MHPTITALAPQFALSPRTAAPLFPAITLARSSLGMEPCKRIDLLDRLLTSGLILRDSRVLKLLPIVYTAWANGPIERVAAERIHTMASIEFNLSDRGMSVLKRWLAHPLSYAYVLEGMRDLYAASRSEDNSEFETSELPMLLAHAEAIARTKLRGMDEPESVGPSQVQALHDMATLLKVDNGQTWTELLRELEPRRLPQGVIG